MKLRETLLNLIYPQIGCSACSSEGPVDTRTGFCQTCMEGLPYYMQGLTSEKGFEQFSVFYYQDLAAALVKRLKYSSHAYLAKNLAAFTYEGYKQAGFHAEYVTYVPIHANKMKTRGYNQCGLICEELQTFGMRKIDALAKTKDTPSQTTLSSKERVENVKGSFEIMQDVKGKEILLLDDVITTGSTIRECAGVLSRAGAKKVLILSLCIDI